MVFRGTTCAWNLSKVILSAENAHGVDGRLAALNCELKDARQTNAALSHGNDFASSLTGGSLWTCVGFFFFCCCFFSPSLQLLSICNSCTLAAGRKRSAPRYELSRYISRRLSGKLLMAFWGAARLARSSQFISRHRLYLSRTLNFVMFH